MSGLFSPGILMVMTFGLLGMSSNLDSCSRCQVGVLTLYIDAQSRYGFGQWTPASRRKYNLVDTLTRHTAQVYKSSNCQLGIALSKFLTAFLHKRKRNKMNH